MTNPYPAPDPQRPQEPYAAQDPYAAQQPYGAQPQYGAQQPYGQQPYGMPAATKRPGVLTAAAVIAFVVGGFSIIGGIALFGLSTLGFLETFVSISGIVSIVLAGLLIWGGVAALGGKNTKILVATCGAAILWTILSAIILVSQLNNYSLSPSNFTSVILPILIIAFCLNAQSREWVRSKGGATF